MVGREIERYLEKVDKDSCEGLLVVSDVGEGLWFLVWLIVGWLIIWIIDYYEDIVSYEMYYRINNLKVRVNVLGIL